MKSQKSMIKSMIIKPDNLTKIMSKILYDPLCYDHSNYHSSNWPIHNASQYLCLPWWSVGMSNVSQNEFPNKTTEVWNSLFKYMFLMFLYHYPTFCRLIILIVLFLVWNSLFNGRHCSLRVNFVTWTEKNWWEVFSSNSRGRLKDKQRLLSYSIVLKWSETNV